MVCKITKVSFSFCLADSLGGIQISSESKVANKTVHILESPSLIIIIMSMKLVLTCTFQQTAFQFAEDFTRVDNPAIFFLSFETIYTLNKFKPIILKSAPAQP
jgi:hypothetical protein